MKNKPSAFTLIELLVVIALIGIFSAIAVVSYQNAQKNGRDQQRKSDLTQIATALGKYYLKHSYYPPSGTAERNCDSSRGSTVNGTGAACPMTGTNWDSGSDLNLLTTEGFIEKLPIDPLNTTSYYYKFEPYAKRDDATECSNYDTSRQDYGCGFYLAAKLERDGSIWCIRAGSTAATCPASL